MRGHVILLYREVFAFLCYTLKWYSSSWNRFRRSFDNKFYDKHVEQRVKRIQGLIQRVRDELNLMSDQTVQDIYTEQNAGFADTANRFGALEKSIDEKLAKLAQMLGEQMCRTLMAHAQHGKSCSPIKPRFPIAEKLRCSDLSDLRNNHLLSEGITSEINGVESNLGMFLLISMAENHS